MNDIPLITVVIPTYKRASLVLRAIRSVQNQTHKNLEIIVVDDASPDNTEKVVRSITDARIRYIRHEQNAGLAANGRNTGIQAACGEFIAFLDDDDEWLDTMIEKQLKVIEAHDAVLCAALVNGIHIKCHRRNSVTLEDLRKGNDFDPSSLMARTPVLKELLFDEDLRQGEDWDLFIRMARKYRIGYLREPLLIYNDGGHARIGNEARNLDFKGLDKRMYMLRKQEKFFGRFWFRYHVAGTLLSHLFTRRGQLRQVFYTIRRCGIIPVAAVMWNKIRRAFRRLIGRV